MQWFLP